MDCCCWHAPELSAATYISIFLLAALVDLAVQSLLIHGGTPLGEHETL